MGYASGTIVRVVDLLLAADDLRVRSEREHVNGAACVVVEFVANQGAFTVWLDTNLGFQLRRAIIARGPTDTLGDELVWERLGDRNASMTETYEWDGFQSIRGVYMPTVYTCRIVIRRGHKPPIRREEHGSRTLSENWEQASYDLWSTGDIPAGTRGSVWASADGSPEPIEYVWQDDALHRLVDADREKDIAALAANIQPRNEPRVFWRIAAYATVCALALAILVIIHQRAKRRQPLH